jgi:hypothetical protein
VRRRPSHESGDAGGRWTSLENNYPTVGSLIDAGFIPYFDFFADGDWAHWINPEFLDDGATLDAERPESILVDNTWWRPIGVMYVATDEGEAVATPQTIHVEEVDDGPDRECIPWHTHVGFPGRLSWWKYQNAYEGPAAFPCRTPWMMHGWRYDHPTRRNWVPNTSPTPSKTG